MSNPPATWNPLAAGGTALYDSGGNVVGPNNPLSVTITDAVTGAAPIAFRQTVTASAVVLATNPLTNGVVIKALTTNAATVYLGPSGVTTSTGYPLNAGEAISYAVTNTNLLYVIGQNTTDVIAVTGN